MRASEIQPASTFSDGTRRTSGCSALVSRQQRREVARAALCELDRRIDPGRLEQIGVLGADAADAHEIDVVEPLEQLRRAQARLARERLASAGVAARWSRWRTCVTPARESADAFAAPMPSITSIFTATLPLPARATVSARRSQCERRRARRSSGRYHPLSAEEMHVSRSSVCRCMLAVLAALLALPAASRCCRPSRRHVRDARDRQRRHGRSAGQRDASSTGSSSRSRRTA